MTKNPAQPQNLVRTQADLVPPPEGATVSEPEPENNAEHEASKFDAEVLRDLKRLAERVGGLEKLKEVVDVLIRLPR
jgi:hypothetical protein